MPTFLALLQKLISIFESSEDFKCRHGMLAMEHSQHCKVAIYLQEHNISIHIYLQENWVYVLKRGSRVSENEFMDFNYQGKNLKLQL